MKTISDGSIAMLITEWIERFNPCSDYYYYKEIGVIKPNYSVKRILCDDRIKEVNKWWLINKTLSTVRSASVCRISLRTWSITPVFGHRSVISTSDLARFMEEIIDYIGEQEDKD